MRIRSCSKAENILCAVVFLRRDLMACATRAAVVGRVTLSLAAGLYYRAGARSLATSTHNSTFARESL
jgi:hypothetical protein